MQHRQQYTVVNDCISHFKEISHGVPQGSVLGPLLFLLYINDINFAVTEGELKLYADDTNLFLNDTNLDRLCDRTNQSLDSLYQWFLANKLSVSFDKTVYNIFSPHHKTINLDAFKLKISNVEVKRAKCCKYLGIMLDDELNWKSHIDYIETKLIKFTSLFYKIRHKLTPECRKALYYAMIYPHLIFAIELYGSATVNNLHKLQMLQNKFLRILQMQGIRCPTNRLYEAYDTFKIRDLHEINILGITHKIIYHPSELPKIYQNYLLFNNDIHDHDTRYKTNIFSHHIRTKMGAKDFKFKSRQLWNVLPVEIRESDNSNQFKLKIRKFYRAKY